MVDLRVPDILAASQSPMGITELAQKADAAAGEGHVYKVLRVLAQWELLEEMPDKKFQANEATKELVRGKEPSLGHFAAHQINQPKADAWKILPQAVQQGKTAFVMAHGKDMYQFCEDPKNGAFATEFNKSMTYYTKHSLRGGEFTLQNAFDWSKTKVVMDVGGGHGELLSHCMLYAGPESKGVLMDRPHVLEGVDLQNTFESKGVHTAEQRLTKVEADVRQPFPEAVKQAGVDTVVMKHFLSHFNDEDAKLTLKHCAQVMPPHGKLLLFQTIVPEPGDRAHNYCKDGVAPGLFAIEILAHCPGGAWRTLSEWKSLFNSAGFKLEDCKEVGASMHMAVWSRE
jgi:cyclopropane fatty-acyl-phospholipid synthase-like methyltransferase